MPLYEYRCIDCHTRDIRIAGADDHTALCVCGELMLRLDEDVFEPYFDKPAKACVWRQAETGEVSGPRVSHGICKRHSIELFDEVPK
ncbi:MAG: hypothetical protein WC749_01925 [Dehalococcoidia bacterium]